MFLVNILAFLRAQPLRSFLNIHYINSEEKNTPMGVSLASNRMHHSAKGEALGNDEVTVTSSELSPLKPISDMFPVLIPRKRGHSN